MASLSQTYWKLVRLSMARKERQLDEWGNKQTESKLRSILKFRISWLNGPAPSIPDDDHDMLFLLMQFVEIDAKHGRAAKAKLRSKS